MAIAHNLGFPRVGAERALKRLLEDYWAGNARRDELLAGGRRLRQRHWELQRDAGLALLPVGDFAWYDQVLNHSVLLGAIPERFRTDGAREAGLDTYFRMARGRAPSGADTRACEMTKWFDTNYHYIVPEFEPEQTFRPDGKWLFDEVEEARTVSSGIKPALIGPLSYLWLGKTPGAEFDRLELLDALLLAYAGILARLAELGADWVQMDEPILALDLDESWRCAFERAYRELHKKGPQLLLATYFGGLLDNLETALALPVQGLHLDRVRGDDPMEPILKACGTERILSLGVIDGRNVWRSDLETLRTQLQPIQDRLGDRLWIAPSCSLLHVPMDAETETELDPELRSWLAFAVQKIRETAVLARALSGEDSPDLRRELEAGAVAATARRTSPRTRQSEVRQRTDGIDAAMSERSSSYTERARLQRERLQLPMFPTTTIGSFPQTSDIRTLRRRRRRGEIDETTYRAGLRKEIANAVRVQEKLGLDVLVHGEAERNDMVEYFGELMEGFAFTRNGWVQSYGSRCVKPPIIYGDVSRPEPMTVEWIRCAQELTGKPVKGMLTGPVTILCWSFPRDDLDRRDVCRQIALALRDEVRDLERTGARIIQIDEPAFREGLPLRRRDWAQYLDWAVECFRLSSCGVKDDTQIHTHMCYSEFNDIIEAIARMDADVITIESARSDMELLEVFRSFEYPNEIGPGVYDIHSPRVPETEEMLRLLHKAAERISPERLWVNPDCGLKTRGWTEVHAALANMVQAAAQLRRDREKSRSPD